MSKLLLQPCPFCGGEATVAPWHGGLSTKVMISCSKGDYNDEDGGCSVGPHVCGETEEDAVARWNRRAGCGDDEKLTPDEAWTILCETPDITSPAEYPDHALITREQLRSYMERVFQPEASNSTPEAEASFTDYFVRNYPGPNTVIYDPKWHAPKIFRAAAYALKNTSWRPIADADLSVTTEFRCSPDLAIRNSDPFWVRDEDGRVFEAVWSVGKSSYWWDLENESPVDPVQFMPHPLDPRFQSKGGA